MIAENVEKVLHFLTLSLKMLKKHCVYLYFLDATVGGTLDARRAAMEPILFILMSEPHHARGMFGEKS